MTSTVSMPERRWRDDGRAPRRLGYLSGGARVSTRRDAEARGPRTHVLGVIGGFRTAGWEVRTFIVGDRMPAAVRNSERRLAQGPAAAVTADVGRLALRHLYGFRAQRELGGGVDWVYERLASFQALGRRFHQAGVPWLLETNALLYEEAVTERRTVALGRYARRLELAAYRECDVVVSVSEELADAVAHQARVTRDKIVVVPNGVDTDAFDPERWSVPATTGDFTVVFVGSLVAWQGLEPLLHAVAKLRDADAIRMRVIIAGDGPLRGALEHLVEALGLQGWVQFLGDLAHDEIPAVIAAGDIAYSGHVDLRGNRVFRSPLKLYEYMAMARPVLASDMSDARALVGPDRGFLFPPGDVAGLQGVLRAAYSQRECLRTMGRIARAEVVARHSWNARVHHLLTAAHAIVDRQER